MGIRVEYVNLPRCGVDECVAPYQDVMLGHLPIQKFVIRGVVECEAPYQDVLLGHLPIQKFVIRGGVE